MKLLKDRITRDGIILPGDVLKLDGFLSHQIDVELLRECAKEWYRLFKDESITKILTIEASGIGLSCIAAQYFNVPVLFAKKMRSKGHGAGELYTTVVSHTEGHAYDVVVSGKYISSEDRVLVIDDFLAGGSSLKALITIAEECGAKVVGAAVAVEKLSQGGGEAIRKRGYRIESLAKIESISVKDGIKFSS